MAINFQLFRKDSDEPERLDVVDAMMCYHFRVECDERRYHAWWFDIIGFKLALGQTWDEVRRNIRDFTEDWVWEARTQHLIDIVNWLEANFTVNHFTSWGRS